MQKWRFIFGAIGCTALAYGATACSDPARGGNEFCSELATQGVALTSTMLTESDVQKVVDAYKALEKVAPIDVRKDWEAVTELMKKSASLDPEDPVAVQELADLAYSTKASADSARKWVSETCGIDIATGLEMLPSTTTTSKAKG